MLDMTFNMGYDVINQLKDIFKIINTSYDLQIVHWYQETVMNSIIALFFSKLKQYFTEKYKANKPAPKFMKEVFKILTPVFFSTNDFLPK